MNSNNQSMTADTAPSLRFPCAADGALGAAPALRAAVAAAASCSKLAPSPSPADPHSMCDVADEESKENIAANVEWGAIKAAPQAAAATPMDADSESESQPQTGDGAASKVSEAAATASEIPPPLFNSESMKELLAFKLPSSHQLYTLPQAPPAAAAVVVTASVLGQFPPSHLSPGSIVSSSLLASALSRDVLPLVMAHESLSVRLRLASVCREWNAALRGSHKHSWDGQGVVLTAPSVGPILNGKKEASPLPAWSHAMVSRVSVPLASLGAHMPQLLQPFTRLRHLHFTGGLHREPKASFALKVRQYAAALNLLRIETLHLPRSVPNTPLRGQPNEPRLQDTDAVATAVFGFMPSSAVAASSSSSTSCSAGLDSERPAILSWVSTLTDLRATLQPLNGHMNHALKTTMMLTGTSRGCGEYAQLRSLDLLLDFTSGSAPASAVAAEDDQVEQPSSAAMLARFLSSEHVPHLTRFALSLWRDPSEHCESAAEIQSAALSAVARLGTLQRLELPAPVLLPASPATAAGQQEWRHDLIASALPLCAADMDALRGLAPTLRVLAVRLPMLVADSEALWATVSHLHQLRELHALTPVIPCVDPNREHTPASIRRARLPTQTEAALPARLALKSLVKLAHLHTLTLPSAPLANAQEADDVRMLLNCLRGLTTLHMQWSLASQSASLVALKESVAGEDCHLVDAAQGEDLAFLLHSFPALHTLSIRGYLEAGLSRRASLVGTVAGLVGLTAITIESMGCRELQALLELWAARAGLFDEVEEEEEKDEDEQLQSSFDCTDSSFSSSDYSSGSSEERKQDFTSPTSASSASSAASSSGSAFPFSPCAAARTVPATMPVPLDWSCPSPLVARATAFWPGRCPCSIGPAAEGRVPMLEHRHRTLSEQIKCLADAEAEHLAQQNQDGAKPPVPELSTTAAVALVNLAEHFPALPDRWTPAGTVLPPRHPVRLMSFTLVGSPLNRGAGGGDGGSMLSREDVFLLSQLPRLEVLDLSRHVGCSWKKLPQCRSLRVLKLRDEDCMLMRDENLMVWAAACKEPRDGGRSDLGHRSAPSSTGAAFPLLESFEVTCALDRRVFSFLGPARVVRNAYGNVLSSSNAIVKLLSDCMPKLRQASLPVSAMSRDTAHTLKQLVQEREVQGRTIVELRDSSVEQGLFTAATIM